METEMIKNLIISYFNVVKKNLNDSIPKTIVTFLVNRVIFVCLNIFFIFLTFLNKVIEYL